MNKKINKSRKRIVQNSETRDKILNSAELEFSKRGYDSCSLRIISNLYDINLGLIHYYFGGKEGLFSELFLRRSRDLVGRRETLLDIALESSRNDPLDVSEIVHSFISPSIAMMKESEGTKAYMRLLGLLRSDTSDFAKKLRAEGFNESSKRFIRELQRSCPHLKPESVVWRFSAMRGSFFAIISQSSRVNEFSAGLADPDDLDAAYREITPFIVGGFSLTVSKPAEIRPKTARQNSSSRSKSSAKLS